ncbi:helix-turn-helix domain-containing protein [Chloroflexota bacterium]
MERLQLKIKALRIQMNWSQEYLARELGVSLSTVQRWETKGAKPTLLARRELTRLLRKAGIKDNLDSSRGGAP